MDSDERNVCVFLCPALLPHDVPVAAVTAEQLHPLPRNTTPNLLVTMGRFHLLSSYLPIFLGGLIYKRCPPLVVD